MDINQILIAFGLTLFAGLATGIGSLLAFFTKSTNTKFLSVALGFSAGVMIYISFMELMPQALHSLEEVYDTKQATLFQTLAFFAGVAVIWLIDMLIPSDENPHEVSMVEDLNKAAKLKRMGFMVALSIAIHNFPEGIAAFAAGLNDLEVAIPIAIAVAIHNIPEGIAVSVPIYHATGDKKKAFRYSFLSGMAEPVGALVAMVFLLPFWNPQINGFVLASISGIMVFISLDELLPGAQRYGEHHLSIMGVIAGMAVMATSLILLM